MRPLDAAVHRGSPRCYMKITAAVTATLVGLIMLVTFLSGWKSVPPDKIMLHYTGGPSKDSTSKRWSLPARTRSSTACSRTTTSFLPATQRTYAFSRDPNAGDKAGTDYISAPSKDNVLFTFEATVYFKLNTKSDVIHSFMDQICFHDKHSVLAWGPPVGGAQT